MRVISGYLGGRQFKSPHGHKTHPMSDKMRGALFAVLGDIEGLTVLDTFAGTGALSYEALSRGAASSLLVDNDLQAQRAIEDNIRDLQIKTQAKLVKANVSGWSDNNPEAEFDLVLCDPPYDKLQISLIQKLVRHLSPGGTLVLSWPAAATPPELLGLRLLEQKNYGDAQLVFYRQTG